MRQFETRLKENLGIAALWRSCSFEWPEGLDEPLPGQFFTVRPSRGTDPLLRRPFAFSGYDRERRVASFIFQARGRSTLMFSELAPGAVLDVLGPLGTGFPKPDKTRFPVLMAGGIGLGPVLFLSSSFEREAIDHTFLFGVRSAEFIPKGIRFPESAVFCTDNGTAGLSGNPVDAWKGMAGDTAEELFACGPHALLKGCRELALSRGAPCWVSVEQTMACGVGACMGCAVKKADGVSYFRACADGPVFFAEALSWE